MQNVLVDDKRIWVDLYVPSVYSCVFGTNNPIRYSSQSVARLNNSWSNNPTVGPRGGRGGKRPARRFRRSGGS
ncbi:hypothetical protein PILCRDRAFT_825110 [Piloderma croceum F 1598]|uniref:Uncharacterized protein n=1 Tax=Piloderma croceum (strain F 1598) TaxID=765440 RepID=A0A0C3AUS4_PILCF|nr:hypothetical protein PILCRDRAFT_825110 [Piloderma croceum F 1598]